MKAFFETPEQMQELIDAYFVACDKDKTPLTITGLALALGFCSRQSIYDYEKRHVYSYTIKRARLTVEQSYELDLRTQYSSGPIFALKNLGWSDKIEEKSDQSIVITID